MYQHSKNYILTLVCVLFFISSLAHAAPSTDFPPDQIDSGLHPRSQDTNKPTSDFIESTQITPVESTMTDTKVSSEETPILVTRKLSQEATFVGTGLWMGSVVDNSMSNTINYFRIGESIYDAADVATEYTLDLTASGYFGWSTGYKFLQDLGKNYEPYMKIALGALYNANEKLGTLISWQRYQIRGEIGCEDLFERGRRWRSELGFTWSGYGGSVYVGVSHAF